MRGLGGGLKFKKVHIDIGWSWCTLQTLLRHSTSASSFRIVRKEAGADDDDEDSDGIAELSNALANLADALGSGKSAHGAVDRFCRVCFDGVDRVLERVF